MNSIPLLSPSGATLLLLQSGSFPCSQGSHFFTEPSEWHDVGYDAESFIKAFKNIEFRALITSREQHKSPVKCDKVRYKRCNRIEIMLGRLKDRPRYATRCDRGPKVFLSAIARAAMVAYWRPVPTPDRRIPCGGPLAYLWITCGHHLFNQPRLPKMMPTTCVTITPSMGDHHVPDRSIVLKRIHRHIFAVA